MKKIFLFLLMFGFMFLPIVRADEKYKTLDLKEVLADEEIEEAFKEYKPAKDAITIYLFRGKGCGYCRAFLTFLNSITDEYGEYFKLESYEVWNDQANATLLGEVSEYLEQPAGGVPYIVIGDKVFAGYANSYDEDIKTAIKELYDTKKSKRYDVFNEMKKNPKKNSSNDSVSSNSVIIWSLVFTLIATVVVMSFVNLKFKELNKKIDELKMIKTEVKNETKSEVKPSKNTKNDTKNSKK